MNYSSVFSLIEQSNIHRYNSSIPAPNFDKAVNDPLNTEQLRRIKAFLDYFMLSQEKVEIEGWDGSKFLDFKEKFANVIEMQKFYHLGIEETETTEAMKKILFGEKAFISERDRVNQEYELLRRVITNPQILAKEFQLNPTSNSQIHAARIFIKSAFKINPWHNHSGELNDVYGEYKKRLFYNNQIRAKHLLQMENDPLKKSSNDTYSTPLDVLLEHAFFRNAVLTSTTRTTFPDGKIEISTQEHGPTREELRQMMISIFQEKYENPSLKHVFDAFALLSITDRGRLYFSGSAVGLGVFTQEKGIQRSLLNPVIGFYNNKHAIYCGSLCNPYDKKPLPENFSTFIHEALHYILKILFANNCDPVNPRDSKAEKELDDVLNLDREHRKAMKAAGQYEGLSDSKKSVWHTFDLIDEEYLNGKFDSENPRHRSIMRIEAIVRPMEQIAWGATTEDVTTIAPHLWQYYQEKICPKIEKWTAEGFAKLHLFKKPFPQKTSKAIDEQIEICPNITNKIVADEEKHSAPDNSEVLQTPTLPLSSTANPQKTSPKSFLNHLVSKINLFVKILFNKLNNALKKIGMSLYILKQSILRFDRIAMKSRRVRSSP